MLTRLIFWLLFLSVLGGGIWYVETTRLPCQTPLHYRLGQFDSQFGISQASFLRASSQAESLWENSLGRELFVYDPEASFSMNLVFDERQARTQAAQALESSLSANAKDRSSIAASYQSLTEQYQKANQAYEKALVNFEQQLAAYNAAVAKWNASDRTDEGTLKQLKQEEQELRSESSAVEEKRQQVNRLVPQVNALARSEQQKVNEYNRELTNFTEHYGTGGEFEQGLYTGTEINIYQFDDLSHLRAVLVHELGHALALDHTTNPQSIMYPLLQEQTLEPLRLSADDVLALRTQCERSTLDQIEQDFGAWVSFWRTLLVGPTKATSTSP